VTAPAHWERLKLVRGTGHLPFLDAGC
jgi:hypothetical protein